MTDYILYAAPISLFSGKARAYLRWKGAKFEEVLTTTEVMREVVPKIGWPVIPVMKSKDGTLVQDTADIIDHVESQMGGTAVSPLSPVLNFVSALLHLYGDEWLTLPAMHYRWNHNEAWIFGEFGRMAAPEADAAKQYELGLKRGQMFKGFVPMLGITPQTAPCIERSYEEFLDEFSAHLESHDFLLGARPCLADFAFYGPLYAHLYRDPASGDLMKARAPNVAAWVERLRDGSYAQGELEAEVPSTIVPLLARHFTEHMDVLSASAKLLADWAKDQKAGTPVPRAFGTTPFTVGRCEGQIIARSFSLFRLQAAMDIYQMLTGEDKNQADALLDITGGGALKTWAGVPRLTRKNYKLVLA